MAEKGDMAVNNPNLKPQERQALQTFLTDLQQEVSEQLTQVALFGSKARGDSQQSSDIDVLVILDREDRDLRRSILRNAARVSLEHDVLLSPRVIGEERWEEMRGFSLYRNVIRDAARLEIQDGNLTIEPVDVVLSTS